MRRRCSRFIPDVRELGPGAIILLLMAVSPPCAARAETSLETLTEIRELEAAAAAGQKLYDVRLEGQLWWASSDGERMVIQDRTGAEEVEVEARQTNLAAGCRIRLEGTGTVQRRGQRFRLGAKGPVVDNDGVHALTEKAGAAYLASGLQPIRVDWFNGLGQMGLEVHYEGPGVERKTIPDTALFKLSKAENWGLTPGVEWKCYETGGEVLPNFDSLRPIKTGTGRNFDPGYKTRDENVALSFSAQLQIKEAGLYTFYLLSDDGSRLFVGNPSFQLLVLGEAPLPEPRRVRIGQPFDGDFAHDWAEVEGKVLFAVEQGAGMRLELGSGSGRMRVEIGSRGSISAQEILNRNVRVRGFCQQTIMADGQKTAGLLLCPGPEALQITVPTAKESDGASEPRELPLLREAAQVHRLKREEAQKGYPVHIKGVITSVLPERHAVTIQDTTRGIYVVDLSTNSSSLPEIGDFIEVEGVTDPSLFAPIVNARSLASVGAGQFPEPIRPTWEQLLNGSLDAQFVEIQGIITDVQTNRLAILTPDGVLFAQIRLNNPGADELNSYRNALVRIRGCLLANWDYVTHRVNAGEVRIYGADLILEEPAPGDLFSVPHKRVSELLLFDPAAGVFQRVKITGQVVHVRGTECFLMDGQTGVRLRGRGPPGVQPGDLVEAVGFPELAGNAAPVLLEAVIRKTGHQSLPEPKVLTSENLMRSDWDATRVGVEGLLVIKRKTASQHVMEVQTGVRTFAATLPIEAAAGIESLPVGSRLGLTGVYAVSGAVKPSAQQLASFELLLDSPDDVRVIARPPWWTLRKLIFALGGLGFILAITVLWITQLRRQVEERTAELGAQIQVRQQAESQRAMEQERSRIAGDLHDELGSSITEVGMLASRAASHSTPEQKRAEYIGMVREKANAMVTSLDEIVWAMNPRHDSLGSLVSYFCLHAERLLGLANITWKFESPSPAPELPIGSHHRHELFLAFREALTNIVRHSGASEVRLRIAVEENEVAFVISDNGRGMPEPAAMNSGMNGLENMKSRLKKLGGRCEIAGNPGTGTTVSLFLPANKHS